MSKYPHWAWVVRSKKYETYREEAHLILERRDGRAYTACIDTFDPENCVPLAHPSHVPTVCSAQENPICPDCAISNYPLARVWLKARMKAVEAKLV